MTVFSSAFKSLYMHVCLCGVVKERPTTLHNKGAGSTHSLQQCAREGEKGRQQDETETSLLSSLSPTLGRKVRPLLSRLIKEGICSKQFYLNLSCLLLLQIHNPDLPPKCNSLQAWFAGLYVWRWEHNAPKGRKATDQMVTKGTNEIEATHTRMHE